MGSTTPPIHIYHRPPFASMIDALCEKENILCFPPKKKERKWNLVAQTNYVIWSICQLIQWAVFICILGISVTDPSISCKCIYSRVEIPRCFARRLITYQFLSPGMGKPLLRRYPLGWSRFFPLPPPCFCYAQQESRIYTHIHAHTYMHTHTNVHTHTNIHIDKNCDVPCTINIIKAFSCRWKYSLWIIAGSKRYHPFPFL